MKNFKTTILAFLALIIGISATAQTESENKKIIQAGFERWASGKGSFFDLLTDDMVWTINGSAPLSKTYNGKQQFLDEVINPLNERLSQKIIPTVRNLFAEDDIVIALIDGKATANDGKAYDMTYAWFMKMKNGKIVKVEAFLDGIQFADVMKRLSGNLIK
jgi:ketosteroid isomerase-like protein